MSAPAFPHPRLYNDDLAPVESEGRHWNAYNVFTMWANDVHSLGNYTFAIGLFALGLGAWQILLTFAIGAAILFALLTLSGFLGEQTGLPFPVVSRIAFGIRGGRVSAICRGGIAIVWFGIQTYLAANVLNALLVSFVPSLSGLEEISFLGLSVLGWCSFIALWAVQIIIVSYGMAMVRHYIAFAGPVILITMLTMAGWVLVRAHFTIAWSINQPLAGVPMWEMIFAGACLWVVIYGTFALNVCDFTRCVGTKRAVVLGNFAGILVNMMLFALIVVVLAGAQFHINGDIIKSPADIVRTINDPVWRIAASLALIVLTIAVNLVANFVAPSYMLCDLFPRWLTFRRAGMVTAIIGLVILPWNLYNSPLVINYFLGGLGAILGPFFGLIMVDYWLVRRQRLNIPDLYSEATDGTYYYRNGFNYRAFYALVPAALISLAIALAPVFHSMADFSWIFGAVIAAVLHLILVPKNQAYQHVDGEAIARPSQ
ncbi:MAG: NCS1 family nucleobase:cation symporter-1 [Salinisphaera sp.]|jgi:NCS1 family nucleobase:cation symporter-1|nr:NCS1 family nucleobase:cation symporter-1 [Salinisphaera sp.]